MAEVAKSRIWLMRGVYLGLALAYLFFHLLPLDTMPRRWAPPDLLVALTFTWVMRRPDFVPAVSVGVAFLAADLLLQRPPGLWSALMVGGCAFLARRPDGSGESGFASEWIAVGIVLSAITLLNRLILTITFAGPAPWLLDLSQLVLTVLAYPLLAGLSQAVFGVRRLAPADASSLRNRA